MGRRLFVSLEPAGDRPRRACEGVCGGSVSGLRFAEVLGMLLVKAGALLLLLLGSGLIGWVLWGSERGRTPWWR